MMFPGQGVTVAVLRKQATNWRGDAIDGGSEFEEHHTISDVLVEMQSNSANKFGRDEYTVFGYLYMEIGDDILATDLVQLPAEYGNAYVHVMGKPFPYNLGHCMGKAIRFKEVGGYGATEYSDPGS